MYSIYTCVGLTFRVNNYAMKDWESFLEEDNKIINFNVHVLQEQEMLHGLEHFENLVPWKHLIRRKSDVMLINENWNDAIVLPLREQECFLSFLCQLFYTQAVQHHIIYLHSSIIAYQHHGLMFLGPSGIGKTTQAELWRKYRDALIINGDVVFVQEEGDAFLGWGTPWHGSSPYCENISVPVSALIVLKQAETNSIRELTGFEKVTAVSESVFYPRWLENGMELCLETLDHLLSRLPVYELSCRPDEEAVRLVEETVFGK